MDTRRSFAFSEVSLASPWAFLLARENRDMWTQSSLERARCAPQVLVATSDNDIRDSCWSNQIFPVSAVQLLQEVNKVPPPSPPSRQHPHCIVCPSNMITSQVSLEGQAFQGRSAIHSCSEVFVEAGQHLSVMQFVFQTIPGVGAFHSQLSG